MSTITIAAEGCRRALDQVLRAASTDPKGGVLRGVLVEAGDASLRLVATDKHRLVVSEMPIKDGAGADFRVVLDAGALAELRDDRQVGDVTMTVDGTSFSVSLGDRLVEVAVLGGDFPDHRAVLRGLTDAADRVALVADKVAVVDALEELAEDGPLRVQLKPGTLALGQLVPIEVDASYDGPAVSVFVEPSFLHDVVVAAPGADVAIEVTDAKSPIVVCTPGDQSYLAVVMPVVVATTRSRRR